MIDPAAATVALGFMVCLALAGWAFSLVEDNVTVVDSLWPQFFLFGAFGHVLWQSAWTPRLLALALLALWAFRLSLHLHRRNHGQPEDRRYQAIRARNQPGFTWKSLYLVFGLQAGLAWLIAWPLFAALGASTPLGGLDALAASLVLLGVFLETVADRQLAAFRADPGNAGQVMDRGLWRYSRHPNYFGEALVWWGFWLFAAAVGAAWTVFSPLIMTLLLLKVSGVSLLERDIAERRPGYRAYVARTSAFIPWPPRGGTS